MPPVDEHTRQQKELLDIFEREMQKAFLLRSANAETDNIELKINKIHHRVDEVTKLLKEEQLLVPDELWAASTGGGGDASAYGRPSIKRRQTTIASVDMVSFYFLCEVVKITSPILMLS